MPKASRWARRRPMMRWHPRNNRSTRRSPLDCSGLGSIWYFYASANKERTMTTNTRQVQPETVARARDVERLVAGQATADGAGVKLTRVLTQPLQRRLDPFLMLDAFGT